MTRLRSPADGVESEAQPSAGGPSQSVRGGYLVGADGPRSMVRSQLGLRYGGESGVVRDFVGGRMDAVFCRGPDFSRPVPHPPPSMHLPFHPPPPPSLPPPTAHT